MNQSLENKKLNEDISDYKDEPVIVLYGGYKSNNYQTVECFRKKHPTEIKPFPFKKNRCFQMRNLLYCKQCNAFLIKEKIFKKYESPYFDGFRIYFSKVKKHKNPSIIVYQNFHSADAECIKNQHPLPKDYLFTKSNKRVMSSYCEICEKYYISETNYDLNKKDGFEYEVIKEQSSTLTKIINIGDFIVRSNMYKCVKGNHSTSLVKASVSIFTNKGMIEETFDAYYCPLCDKSYILESTYNRLKALGHICCKVIEYQDLVDNFSDFNSWQKKSLLAIYGYSVNKNQSLSTVKRHMIIDIIIENNVMKPVEIVSHLEMLIHTRQKIKSMTDARQKWMEDIDYVHRYKKVNGSVKVRSIYAKV